MGLQGNSLTGRLPSELGLLATNGSLSELRLNGNSLSGFVSASLCLVDIISFGCGAQVCGCDCDRLMPTGGDVGDEAVGVNETVGTRYLRL